MKLLIILLLFVTKSCLARSSESHEISHESAHLKFIRKSHTNFTFLTKNKSFSKVRKSKYFYRASPSVLIIHGAETNYLSEFAKTLVDAFLSRNEHNVIFGDWSAYASDDYSDVAHQVEHISNVFVDLLNKIKNDGYDLSRVYVVGHGLGAHIAGRIGNRLQYQNVMLSRITGLDPAGPLFDHQAMMINMFGISASDNIPLSKDDAKFVDIIHSNAGLYRGMMSSQGHLDFWPNCGIFQPHCSECNLFFDIFTKFKKCSQCSHAAAWRFYAESVKSKIPTFEAKKCSMKILKRFFCNGDRAYMGYYASSSADSGDYYVETNDDAPYSK